jgi:hypothetical protein
MAFVKKQLGHFDESLKWLMKAHEISLFSTAGGIAFNYLRKNDYAATYKWVMQAKEYDPAEPANYLEAESALYFNLGLLDSMKNSIYNARKLKRESPEIDQVALYYHLFTRHEEEYIRLTKKSVTQDDKELAYRLGQFYFFQRDWKVGQPSFLLYAFSNEIKALSFSPLNAYNSANR